MVPTGERQSTKRSLRGRWTPWQHVFNLLNPMCRMDKLQTCPHGAEASDEHGPHGAEASDERGPHGEEANDARGRNGRGSR